MEQTAHFPEAWFPPVEENQGEYRNTLQQGLERMRGRTAVVTGLARNIAPFLERTQARIERLGGMFADYRVVLYENDSRDDTLERLQQWERDNPKVSVLTEILGDPIHPTSRCLDRASRMAYYRNQYRQFIRDRFPDYDYVIVLDTDLAGGWSYEGVMNTFGRDDWDFVGSNGIIYKRHGMKPNLCLQYDAWAYRELGNEDPLPTKLVNDMFWKRGDSLEPVFSCFGGLGVYRAEAFLASQYSGGDIEHVGFHQGIREKGFTKLYLNPSQITLYGRHHRTHDRVVLGVQRALHSLGISQRPSWRFPSRRAA
ncbi:MAG: glycosyltransferase family 2 protein [Planctomycetales bacterium]